MNPTLRPYRSADFDTCLELFRSNVPRFFAPHEENAFADFLAREALTDCDYFVVEDEHGLIACGGTFVRRGVAGLCWGLVVNAQHRRGVGSLLLQGRLEHLYRRYPNIREVKLDTSQHSQGFFARFGFALDKVTPDAYAPGLDRYDMTLSREMLAARFGRA